MNPQDEHRIDKMKEDLYSRDFTNQSSTPRNHFSTTTDPVAKMWKHDASDTLPIEPKKHGSWVKKVLIGAVIFFVLSIAAAIFVFFGGLNIISSDKVTVSFSGPTAIAAGDDLNFDIIVQNLNNTDLLAPTLYIDYPEGTKQIDDLAVNLNHGKEILKDIPRGQSARTSAEAVLFGQEGETKEIKVTVEYRVKGSDTAVFKKEKIYDVTISSTPLSITVNGPKESVAGDQITFGVDIVSNSSVPLDQLLLRIDYPFGFTFKGAEPAVTHNNNIWEIAELKPGEKQTFAIQGILEGEQNDERTFRFNVGSKNPQNDKEIATTYLSSQSSVALRKPPIAVVLTLGEASKQDLVTSAGQDVTGRVEITNNLPVQLNDVIAEVSFDGPVFDPGSPGTQTGFYRSLDKTIVWDKTMVPQLGSLKPGDRVLIDFTFASLPRISVVNGTMTAKAAVQAKRVATDGGDTVRSSSARTVRVQSVLGFAQRLVYSIGPFQNTGSVPPQAEKPTTYTVIWTVTNTSNIISSTQVRAILPQYVSWKNNVSTTTGTVAWKEDSREVAWLIGEMAPGSTKQVTFQVSILPSTTQVGSAPIMISNAVVQAIDTFTNKTLTVSGSSLTTSLPTDPKYSSQTGIVKQ